MRKRRPEKSIETGAFPLYNIRMKVYLLDVTSLPAREAEAMEYLTDARREKAARLRPGPARCRSMGAGLLLRRFLADREIRIAPRGKPFCPGGPEFSLSHSGRWAALALDDAPVGLDVETVALPKEALARRVLTEEERVWLSRAGGAGFAFLWTRKEAALKLLGTGVDRSLAGFGVLPGAAPVLDGRTVRLWSASVPDAVVSAASEHSAVFELEELTLDEILAAKES